MSKLNKYAITIEEVSVERETYFVEAEDVETAKNIVENAYHHLFIGPDGYGDIEMYVNYNDVTDNYIEKFGEEHFNSKELNTDVFVLGVEYFPDNESMKKHLERYRDKRLKLIRDFCNE